MIELIKFELKKIFSNKLIFIVMALFAALMLYYVYDDYHDIKESFGSKQELISIAEKYKNSSYSPKELSKMRTAIEAKYIKNEQLSKDEQFLLKYYGLINITDGIKKTEIDRNIYTYDEIQKHIDELKGSGKENTYQYKNFLKAHDMLSKLDNPHNVYKGNWDKLFDGVTGTIKIVLLVLGVASIYSKEYKTRVSYLNLSTKKGRSTLNTAKVIASLIYTVIVFTFVTIMYRIRALAPGLANGSTAMNSFSGESIFNISINQYYVLSLCMSLLGMICFTLLIILLSLVSKNILISFGLPLGLYILPEALNLPKYIVNYTLNINFTQLLKGAKVFRGYLSFNIFGNAVIYPYVIITFAVVSIVIMTVLCHIFNKRQVIA